MAIMILQCGVASVIYNSVQTSRSRGKLIAGNRTKSTYLMATISKKAGPRASIGVGYCLKETEVWCSVDLSISLLLFQSPAQAALRLLTTFTACITLKKDCHRQNLANNILIVFPWCKHEPTHDATAAY